MQSKLHSLLPGILRGSHDGKQERWGTKEWPEIGVLQGRAPSTAGPAFLTTFLDFTTSTRVPCTWLRGQAFVLHTTYPWDSQPLSKHNNASYELANHARPVSRKVTPSLWCRGTSSALPHSDTIVIYGYLFTSSKTSAGNRSHPCGC